MRRTLLAVVLSLSAAPALAKPPATVESSAAYGVDVDHGAVRGLEVRPRGGGRIVADDFATDPASRESEAAGLSGTVCDAAACRTTCGYARLARPFRRLTRYDAAGRRLWTWRVHGGADAIQLLGRPGADCLSPDGRYLTVTLYHADGAGLDRLGPGVLDVAQPRLATASGLGSDKDAVVGWAPGDPARLIVEEDAGVAHEGPPRYRSSRPRP